jgi:hexosaminidase
VWAEQIDETNYEGVIWPRAAAVAELLWTGSASTVNNTFPRSSLEAFPRMNDIRYRLVDGGINAIPLQPEWCALRPHKCDYV